MKKVKTKVKVLESIKDGDVIASFEALKDIVRLSDDESVCFDVKIHINNGIFSRKTVYSDLNVFNYIDETSTRYVSPKSIERYWLTYFNNYKVTFDGFN